MGEYVHSGFTDIRNDMRTNQAEMEQLIQKGQNMFEGTAGDVRLLDRQIEVSMKSPDGIRQFDGLFPAERRDVL